MNSAVFLTVIILLIGALTTATVFLLLRRQEMRDEAERIAADHAARLLQMKPKMNLVFAENYQDASHFANLQHWSGREWKYVHDTWSLRGYNPDGIKAWIYETAYSNPNWPRLWGELCMIEKKGKPGSLEIVYP